MKNFHRIAATAIAAALALAAECASAQTGKDRYRGFNGVVETGGFVGADMFETTGYSPLSVVGGYTLNRHWFLGAGVRALN